MTGPERLQAYLARIRLGRVPQAEPTAIEALLQAHRQTIGFENLDIRLGRPVRIDSDSVFEKLVARGRGGYCFEQNRLLSDMLAEIGVRHRPLLARVRLGIQVGEHPPRTHVLLLAELQGSPWVVDAGFGGSYVPALPLADGAEAPTPDGARHRLRRIGEPGSAAGEWLLERAGPPAATDGRGAAHSQWQAQYSFDLHEVAQADLEQANHWTSTAPASRFVNLHIATVVLPEGFASLSERTLRVSDGATRLEQEIGDPQSFRAVLEERFGIALGGAEAARLPLFGQR